MKKLSIAIVALALAVACNNNHAQGKTDAGKVSSTSPQTKSPEPQGAISDEPAELPPLPGDSVLVGDQSLLKNILHMDKMVVNGNGCSITDSAKSVVSLDEQSSTIEIAPASFLLNGGGSLSRSNCSFAVPLTLPSGKSLIVSQVDVVGDVSLPADSSLVVTLEAFAPKSVPQTEPVKSELFSGADLTSGRLLTRKSKLLEIPCGSDDSLRLNTSALLKNKSGQNAYADVKKISISLEIGTCN